MKSQLSHLGNNEAILLMYLADELSAEDRADVDRRLAADEAMRCQLRELSETNDVLAKVVAVSSDGFDVERVIRHTAAAMRQRQVELANRPAPQEVPSRLRLPWWCYPVAAAASIILAAAVFFANMEPTPATPPIAKGTSNAVQDIMPWQTFSGLSKDPITANSVADEMMVALDDSGAMLAESGDRGLARATRDMESLRESSRATLGAMDVSLQYE